MSADPEAMRRLQANVTDLIGILLAERGLEVERHDDGRRRLPSLEIHGERGAAVVIHIDQVIG